MNPKLPKLLVSLAAVALVLSACGGAAASSTVAVSPQSAEMASEPQAAPASDAKAAPALNAADSVTSNGAAGQPANGAPQAPNAQTAQQAFDRLVIKTADLAINVEDVRTADAALRTRIATLGGYIIESQSNGVDDTLTMNVSFRVPVDRFDDALGGVQGLAKKVLSMTVHGDDVTAEFVDLQSKQRTLEATRDRLLALLARAETVEDTLRVNQNVTEVQTQIDQIQGRVKFLSQSSAMSTINVAITPVIAPEPEPVVEQGWQPLKIASAALHNLTGFGQVIASILIVLLIWSPVWGVLLLLGLWLARRLNDRDAPKRVA